MIPHEEGDGYYDSFKNHMDTNANVCRVTLGEFLGGIIKMRECHALSSDFKAKRQLFSWKAYLSSCPSAMVGRMKEYKKN